MLSGVAVIKILSGKNARKAAIELALKVLRYAEKLIYYQQKNKFINKL